MDGAGFCHGPPQFVLMLDGASCIGIFCAFRIILNPFWIPSAAHKSLQSHFHCISNTAVFTHKLKTELFRQYMTTGGVVYWLAAFIT